MTTGSSPVGLASYKTKALFQIFFQNKAFFFSQNIKVKLKCAAASLL